MKQVVLDTETTGLSPDEGHRIIEIGCVELIDRKLSGKRFHAYLNPDREIDQGAIEVHGLDNDFLADKPRFTEVVDDFLLFVQSAELIIHNAPFDVGFLNAELKRTSTPEKPSVKLESYCTILDTLVLARKMHPGQRNSLDALCKRHGVDNRHRDLHGALLDAEILAEVYLAMTGGQMLLQLEEEEPQNHSTARTGATEKPNALPIERSRRSLRVIRCADDELLRHNEKLDAMERYSGMGCVWRQEDNVNH